MNKDMETLNERNKRIHDEVINMMEHVDVPGILPRRCARIFWLQEIEPKDICDAVRMIWGYAKIWNYHLLPYQREFLVKIIERGIRHIMEKFNPELVGQVELNKRLHCIEMLINMCCYAHYNEDGCLDLLPVPEEDIIERVELVYNADKYKDIVIDIKSADDIFIRKMWNEYQNGKELTNINIDYNECEKEYEDYKNGKRKKVVDMYDVDTKEVIYTFDTRNECIEQTGISKSRLSQCLSSSCNEEGWMKWKDKINNKYYYFKEREL